MKTFTVAMIAALLCSVIVSAQAPTAGPEYKRLDYFVGTWNFTGDVKASPMGPAGAITFTQVCETMPGGFAVVCRSEGKTPMGPSKAVAIMSYDADRKTYTYHAAESHMPAFTALGEVKGAVWTWTTSMTMGGQKISTRVTQTEGGPKTFDFLFELSVDGSAFAPMVQGKMVRAS